MRNTHLATTHMIKSYINQIISNIINYYNSALTTVYNKIAILEVQNVQLQAKLTSLPESSIIVKIKVPKLLTFVDLENKIQLNN